MSWIEQIEPDDDIKVEIIYPQEYIDYNCSTMTKYSSAASMICKAAAILEMDRTDFFMEGITVLQSYALQKVFQKYGVKLEFELFRYEDMTSGEFYADVSKLRKAMENENETAE